MSSRLTATLHEDGKSITCLHNIIIQVAFINSHHLDNYKLMNIVYGKAKDLVSEHNENNELKLEVVSDEHSISIIEAENIDLLLKLTSENYNHGETEDQEA